MLLCDIYDINSFVDFDVVQHDLQSAFRQWLDKESFNAHSHGARIHLYTRKYIVLNEVTF